MCGAVGLLGHLWRPGAIEKYCRNQYSDCQWKMDYGMVGFSAVRENGIPRDYISGLFNSTIALGASEKVGVVVNRKEELIWLQNFLAKFMA